MTACDIVPFPCARRTGQIRHVADILFRKHGRDAAAYWRRTVNGMRNQMMRAGVGHDEAALQLRLFFDAVQAEIVSRAHRSTGGAA